MKVLIVKRKNYHITVIKMKVGDLFIAKCSNIFKAHNFSPDKEVYVKCDDKGNIEYRGKKQEYRLYDIDKHELVVEKPNKLISFFKNIFSTNDK